MNCQMVSSYSDAWQLNHNLKCVLRSHSELLIHIFTIGCQFVPKTAPSDADSEDRDSWAYDSDDDGDNTYTSFPHPRRLKPVAFLVCQVCVRWKALVHLGSNAHMYTT